MEEHWTFDMVEQRLVEAVTYWWRSAGSGRSPFASDGPWNLIVPEWSDWGAHDRVEEEPRPLPLSRAQIRSMQEATEWLLYVPEADRRVLCMGLRQLAMGKDEPDWRMIAKANGLPRGSLVTRRRYTQGITAICTRLNGSLVAQSAEIGA